MRNMNIENSDIFKVCVVAAIGVAAVSGCTSNETKPINKPITETYKVPQNETNTYIAKDYEGNLVKVICNGFVTFEDIQQRMQNVGVDFDSAARAMQVIDPGSNLPTVPEYIQITYAANGVTDASAIPELNTLRFPNSCDRNPK